MTNDIHIFNRNLVKHHRDKAAKHISEHDFIINLASSYMLERLNDMQGKYPLALDIGCHAGGLGEALIKENIAGDVIFSDISAKMLKNAKGLKVIADEEFLPFAPSSFNLIVSSMSMHWVNDLPGALIQFRKTLKPSGVFIATMPGIDTLKELRHCLMEAELEVTGGISPHISPFSDVKTMGHLLQRAGFRYPVADSEEVQVSYTDIFALMHDIKNMGEQNALIKRNNYIRRDVIAKAAEKYQSLYASADGGIVATVEIITITGLAV